MQRQDNPLQFAARIAVDDRERSSGVAEALRSRSDVDITFRRLSLGDYEVDSTLIVERKTLTDFAVSVLDGRLFRQVGRLARNHEARSCLILEGTPERYPRLAIPAPAFQGALIMVALVFGVPVLRSATPEETADLILFAARQLQRQATLPPRRMGAKGGSVRRSQLLLLQAVPMVGPLRAEALLEFLGPPSQIANTDAGTLAEVDGIGPTIAASIHRVMHQDAGENAEPPGCD
jgi:DNA excision repair protein ERCC-4